MLSGADKTTIDSTSGTNSGDEVDFAGPGANGLVPDPTTATGKVLNDSGVWVTVDFVSVPITASFSPAVTENTIFIQNPISLSRRLFQRKLVTTISEFLLESL